MNVHRPSNSKHIPKHRETVYYDPRPRERWEAKFPLEMIHRVR